MVDVGLGEVKRRERERNREPEKREKLIERV